MPETPEQRARYKANRRARRENQDGIRAMTNRLTGGSRNARRRNEAESLAAALSPQRIAQRERTNPLNQIRNLGGTGGSTGTGQTPRQTTAADRAAVTRAINRQR